MLGAGDTELTLTELTFVCSFIQQTVASISQMPSTVLGTGSRIVMSKTDMRVCALRKLIVQ